MIQIVVNEQDIETLRDFKPLNDFHEDLKIPAEQHLLTHSLKEIRRENSVSGIHEYLMVDGTITFKEDETEDNIDKVLEYLLTKYTKFGLRNVEPVSQSTNIPMGQFRYMNPHTNGYPTEFTYRWVISIKP